ncbi:hypothetical protein VTI74DRAFT_8825 [Chaetomium olivicolor]
MVGVGEAAGTVCLEAAWRSAQRRRGVSLAGAQPGGQLRLRSHDSQGGRTAGRRLEVREESVGEEENRRLPATFRRLDGQNLLDRSLALANGTKLPTRNEDGGLSEGPRGRFVPPGEGFFLPLAREGSLLSLLLLVVVLGPEPSRGSCGSRPPEGPVSSRRLLDLPPPSPSPTNLQGGAFPQSLI